jgi:hypothetical protein
MMLTSVSTRVKPQYALDGEMTGRRPLTSSKYYCLRDGRGAASQNANPSPSVPHELHERHDS